MSLLNNKFFFLSPVEVVKVTPKNLEEVAEWCGGKIAKVESRRVKGRIDSYVWVPTPKGAAISWAFPGMYITKRLAVTEKNELKATFSVFRKDYFTKNYFSEIKEAVDQTWERQDRATKAANQQARTITIVVAEDQDPATVALQIQDAISGPSVIDDIRKTTSLPEAELLVPDLNGDDLPESMVAQREAIHEDAVEAAAESA